MSPHQPRRAGLAITLVVAVTGLASPAAATPEAGASAASAPGVRPGLLVIAPGQDELLRAMLGGRDEIAGCRLAGASVDRDQVRAAYDCAGGQKAELMLRHPQAAGPEAAARGGQLAVVSRDAPAPLVEEVSRRVQGREASFRWISPMEAPRRPPESEPAPPAPPARPTRAPPWWRLWGLLLLPCLPLLRAASPGRQALGSVALGLATFSLVHGLLGCLGDAVVGGAYRSGLLVAGAGAGALVATAALVAVRATWGSAVATRRQRLLAAGAALAAAALSWGSERREASPGPVSFGRLIALRPGLQATDDTPGRPETHYTTSRRGFRGPDFSDEPAPGVTRIALVGDSYVFGSGIPWEETIGEALRAELGRRAPGRSFETINLGLPGDNLPSHVDAYDEAAARLHPAIVVLFLTLPNDLSASDDQSWRKESEGRPFDLVKWAFGAPLAGVLWHAGRLESSFSPVAMGVLQRETARLVALRGPSAPALLVYSYFGGPPEVLERLRSIPGARLVPAIPSEPSQWIPGDGHPTGEGNRAFARPIASAVLGL